MIMLRDVGLENQRMPCFLSDKNCNETTEKFPMKNMKPLQTISCVWLIGKRRFFPFCFALYFKYFVLRCLMKKGVELQSDDNYRIAAALIRKHSL